MAQGPLACTVRGCTLPLTRTDRTYQCASRHSYDIARSGYVNLLQPQDRRSLAAGDPADVVDARVRLEQAGAGQVLMTDLVARAHALTAGNSATVAELGSGTGQLLQAIAASHAVSGIGIDLSTAAADHAARRYPHVAWVVANADRRLPLVDASVDLLVSVHARRNPSECARVLRPDGVLLAAVPAHDDLIELRATVQGAGVERHRAGGLIAEHEPHFAGAETWSVRETRPFEGSLLRDLLRVTYRGARQRSAGAVDALDAMMVTLASDVVLFRRRQT